MITMDSTHLNEERPFDRIWASHDREFDRLPTAKNLDIRLASVLRAAQRKSKHVTMTYAILGGTPRIDKTRVSVAAILDALEFHGDLNGVLRSYPQLTIEQVRDAILYASAVLECPVVE